MPYKTLSAAKVIDTTDRLSARVRERFPEAGLAAVAAELAELARRSAEEAERLKRPIVPIRASVYLIWALGAAALPIVSLSLHYGGIVWEARSLVQLLDSAMNIAVLTGIGVITLGRLEDRWKRNRALEYLHELRSIAHVIDMHQLTKDPYRWSVPATPSTPQGRLHGPLLERYLDYCTEMLSLTAKLAALFAQSCKDGEVTSGANDLEQLSTALSRKIWQKIAAFQRLESAGSNDESA